MAVVEGRREGGREAGPVSFVMGETTTTTTMATTTTTAATTLEVTAHAQTSTYLSSSTLKRVADIQSCPPPPSSSVFSICRIAHTVYLFPISPAPVCAKTPMKLRRKGLIALPAPGCIKYYTSATVPIGIPHPSNPA